MDETLLGLLPDGDETKSELMDKYKACFLYVVGLPTQSAALVALGLRVEAIEADHAKLIDMVRNMLPPAPPEQPEPEPKRRK